MTGWLSAGHSTHWRWALAVTILAIVASGLLPTSTDGLQLALAAASVAIFGVPHGALDHLVARRLIGRRWNRRSALFFLSGYAGIALVVICLWLSMPAVGLGGFLLISILHFGLGDLAPTHGASARRSAARVAEAIARGAIPIVTPCVAFPERVARYFGWLLTDGTTLNPAHLSAVAGLAAIPLAGVLCWTALRHLARWRARRDPAELRVPVEICALLALFSVAPPLLAFAVYFCGWHSARHALHLASHLDPIRPQRATLRFARHAAPLTLLTLGLAAGAWAVLSVAGVESDPALARVLFMGLAGLTVPHMLVTALDELPTLEVSA